MEIETRFPSNIPSKDKANLTHVLDHCIMRESNLVSAITFADSLIQNNKTLSKYTITIGGSFLPVIIVSTRKVN